MKWIASWCVRSASKIPLTPSPGNPKIVSTPHATRRSTNRSAVVFFAIIFLPLLHESRNAFAPGCRRRQGGPDRRTLHVALIGIEDAVALRDEIIGRARRKGLDRQPRIRGALRGQNAAVAHEEIGDVVRAPVSIHH